jgi:hypothetical protein
MHVHVPLPAASVAASIRRVKVTTADEQTGPYVQLVKDVDPETGDVVGDEFAAVTDDSHAEEDELYIFSPTNGLKDEDAATYDGADVIWRELVGGGGTAKRFKVTGAGLDTVTAEGWDGTTADGVTVTITAGRYHDVDDIIYATKVSNVSTETWIEDMRMPQNTTQYKVYQVDAAGRILVDWVRAH